MPDLFDANYTLERKVKSWENISTAKLKNELSRVCAYLLSHPRSSSREISKGIRLERTSVCRVLATNKKYFNTEHDKICSLTSQTVTAYELSPEGVKSLEGKTQ